MTDPVGIQTRLGSLTANKEWYLPWRTITDAELANYLISKLQVNMEGVLEKRRFLDLICYFIVFEGHGSGRDLDSPSKRDTAWA
jgi:type I restriction enzyme R subunit